MQYIAYSPLVTLQYWRVKLYISAALSLHSFRRLNKFNMKNSTFLYFFIRGTYHFLFVFLLIIWSYIVFVHISLARWFERSHRIRESNKGIDCDKILQLRDFWPYVQIQTFPFVLRSTEGCTFFFEGRIWNFDCAYVRPRYTSFLKSAEVNLGICWDGIESTRRQTVELRHTTTALWWSCYEVVMQS